jgi:hypothetical protein
VSSEVQNLKSKVMLRHSDARGWDSGQAGAAARLAARRAVNALRR